MQQAYRGLYSFAIACKLQGVIKDWPKGSTEEFIYENRFKFMKDQYRYVNYNVYQSQIQSFCEQHPTVESAILESKKCLTASA